MPHLRVKVLMKEPSCVGHTGTPEPDVCGDCVGEDDLEDLLGHAGASDPGNGGVGAVEDTEADTEAEGDEGDQDGGHLTGEQPAGGGQAQRLTLILQESRVKVFLRIWTQVTK